MEDIFGDMTKEELKTFFEECGIEVEVVEEGKGGFFIDGLKLEVLE